MLAVRASGGSGVLTYQWIKNGEPFSEESHSDCTDVYSDTLQFLSLATEHSGTYACRVHDKRANCILESNPAVLIGMFYIDIIIYLYPFYTVLLIKLCLISHS